jgi:uncharacterized protein (DUF58 family)
MQKRRLWRLLLIFGLLAVGWGPLLIAQWVASAHPDRNPDRITGFMLGWGLGVTAICSLLAVALVLLYAVRLIVARVARFIEQRREGSSPGQAGGPEEK